MLFWPDPAGAGTGPSGSDKVVHALLFALLSATARARFGAARGVLAAVLGYAAVSEVVQGLALAERSGDPWDLLADAVGALLGWAAVRRVPDAR